MTEYETTVVIRPDIGGNTVESTLDRVRDAVKGNGGKLLAINHWGKKKLAYEIKKHSRGIYVHTQYLGEGKVVSELERNLRISDNVLRYLTVQVAHQVDPSDRSEAAYEVPNYDEPEPEPEPPAREAAPSEEQPEEKPAEKPAEKPPEKVEAAPEEVAEAKAEGDPDEAAAPTESEDAEEKEQ